MYLLCVYGNINTPHTKLRESGVKITDCFVGKQELNGDEALDVGLESCEE